jgi:hypothetical protein
MQYVKRLLSPMDIHRLPTSTGSAGGAFLFFFLAAAGGIAISSASADA